MARTACTETESCVIFVCPKENGYMIASIENQDKRLAMWTLSSQKMSPACRTSQMIWLKKNTASGTDDLLVNKIPLVKWFQTDQAMINDCQDCFPPMIGSLHQMMRFKITINLREWIERIKRYGFWLQLIIMILMEVFNSCYRYAYNDVLLYRSECICC